MLRRLKIGGRLNLLIAVPLLAMVAVAAVGYVALERSSVRGEEYQALKLAQDLRADTVAPPASLLEAWAQVNHIGVIVASEGFTPEAIEEIGHRLDLVAAAKDDFDEAMATWAGEDLDPAVETDLVETGGAVGREFFQVIDDQLVPALASEDVDGTLQLIRGLESQYDAQQVGVDRALAWAEPQIAAHEQRTDDFVGTVMVIAGAAAAVLVLLTLLLSVRVRRSIVRPIRALAARARAVSEHELPEAVATVADLAPGAPAPRLAPFEVATRDELAELGESFTSVQDTAVELAAEHAMARRVVSENLVNIARRNQGLLGRTLGLLSELERDECDPDVLEHLFRIDHLTTRMRRNAQSLLVLAGAEPVRLWTPPVTIGDVVRAALSEVENYGQVDLAELGDVAVQGALASEISHLLAELIENAISFSPPMSGVTVLGSAAAEGHQLCVVDHGVGMSADELADANRRLREVAAFDRESSRMLGFQVVSRLARRHGISVTLTATPGESGVTAVVVLPKRILEDMPAPGTVPPVADFPAASAALTAPLPITSVVATTPLAEIEPV